MVVKSLPHFVIFPYMAQGHTIPLLHFARLLLQRNISVSIFTTPANSSIVRATLPDAAISIIELTFETEDDCVTQGIQKGDKLPSFFNVPDFIKSTKKLQPQFEKKLEDIKPVSCLISDGFLGWTQDSAEKFGIPRIGFFGMGSFATTMYSIISRQTPHALTTSLDEPFAIPHFPQWSLTRNDLQPPFNEIQPKGPWVDFMIEQYIALAKSYGMIVNSFYELESAYTEYYNHYIGPKIWCVGPFCEAKPPTLTEEESAKPKWKEWLDEKSKNGESVLYVAFGTQAEVSREQLLEIAEGLEHSMVKFLWVIKPKEMEFLKEFERRINDRGMIMAEWIDQMEVLKHKSIEGFLSHCGWNSLTESICAGVPILAMPFIAEQHLNTRLVVEEIGVGLRIWPSNGTVRGFVKSDEVEKKVREIMEGKIGEEIRKKMKMVGEAACGAMREGGSSWRNLDQLVCEVMNYQPK